MKDSRDLVTENTTMAEVMEKIAGLPMEGEPGQVFHYSSIGLQIAAAVIEQISGKNFKQLFENALPNPAACDTRILAPAKSLWRREERPGYRPIISGFCKCAGWNHL